jgi:NAD(P)-dependent dehydrogenase (short-subunit alcohol dehydrogenase family)
MVTTDGFEYHFQVNYLSHYLLTRHLLNHGSTCRIVNVTSKLYESAQLDWNDLNFEKDFVPTKGYQRSKLCNILFTNYLKGKQTKLTFSYHQVSDDGFFG